MTVRVLVADDHGAIRTGRMLMLGTDPDIEVIGEAADGDTRRLISAFAVTSDERPAPPNAQISSRLRIGETTVKTHVSRVLTKLGVRSRVQAAIIAQEHGLDRHQGHVRNREYHWS